MSHGDTLQDWLHALILRHKGHWYAARYYEAHNFWLGWLAAACAAISGTALFATLEGSPSLAVKILMGLFSLVAAVLSSLQTYFRSSELAKRHKSGPYPISWAI